ncbi:MAG TPA: hypothetical protein VK789_22545 [Bryobacteraceae bacterium]|nr:hypothetical protein [Bryobacteraceae bacterium]
MFARFLALASIPTTVAVLLASDIGPLESSIVPIDHPAIRYAEVPADDPVARLNRQLESGTNTLAYRSDGLGYLPSVLEKLGVNPDSQMLVFSKTSFQAVRISPRNPRAIFFSDDVMVGSVRGGDVLEFAAVDSRQGAIFYSLDVQKTDQPRFIRRDSCLQCHQGPASLGVPGIMVGSVNPDASGMPASRTHNPTTDQRTQIQERWGGWYVTGLTGGMNHKGNAVAIDSAHPDVLDMRASQNLISLAKKFDPAGFMSQTSDIIALMTLEHQTRMTNLLLRAGWDARVAEYDAAHGKPGDDNVNARMAADVEEIVDYMLFVKEARLYDQIEGVSTFSRTFPERGPRDKQGRSLRDFDMEKRMFRYPLSYMIYSAAFDAMPDPVRERVYQRLYDVLSGKDKSEKFSRLSADDRSNILEIVRETKPDLPPYWRTSSGR